MSFVEGLMLKYKQIVDQCYMELFVQDIGNDTLSSRKFKNYVVQNSIFLRSYIKSFGYGLTKCNTMKDMKRFYQMTGLADDCRNITRLDCLRQFGLTDEDVDMVPKKIECHQYCEFLENNASKGDITGIVLAGLPYMLVNQYVFTELKKNYPRVVNGKYAALVNDHTSMSYDDFCKTWVSYANGLCEGLEEKRMKDLEEIFKQAIFHELYFWQMAGREEEQK